MSELVARSGAVVTRAYGPSERRRDELEANWLVANRHRYIGLWIALDGDELLAVAPTAREVFAAVAGRVTVPLVMEIEAPAPFAGW